MPNFDDALPLAEKIDLAIRTFIEKDPEVNLWLEEIRKLGITVAAETTISIEVRRDDSSAQQKIANGPPASLQQQSEFVN